MKKGVWKLLITSSTSEASVTNFLVSSFGLTFERIATFSTNFPSDESASKPCSLATSLTDSLDYITRFRDENKNYWKTCQKKTLLDKKLWIKKYANISGRVSWEFSRKITWVVQTNRKSIWRKSCNGIDSRMKFQELEFSNVSLRSDFCSFLRKSHL